MPGTTVSPVYVGVSPIACLEESGLADARTGIESGVWEANVPGSSEEDSNSVVFISGPYGDDDGATQYAQELTGVELAAPGGRWVASASLNSNLNLIVDKAAACMASGS